MSNRRLDKLEGSLSPREAVIHWLTEACAYGSLPAYGTSLIDQPEAIQPFIAVPAQVEKAVWDSMRGQPSAFVKKVMREATGDTVFLLRLVIGLNVHIEETLRVERLRHLSLFWWSRVLDPRAVAKGKASACDRSEWHRGVGTLRAVLAGAEQARRAAEARYLDGHDCLFPVLSADWRDLSAKAELLMGDEASLDERVRMGAEHDVQQVVRMARADGLDASGRWDAADAMAARVAQVAFGGVDG
jgi:hypothetical protein